jgi:hypothetical protein
MSIDTRAQRAADAVHASARGVDPMTQIVDLKREVKTRQRTGMVVTGVAVLALVVGALAVTTRWVGSDEAAPPAGPSVTTQAQQVAAGFFTAYDTYDANRMLTYLSDEAVLMAWDSTEGLRGNATWRQAAGWTELREPCQASKPSGSTVELRCDYRLHALGSEQLGRGPFEDNYWSLHVRDGQIVYARSEFPFGTNGFADEMWEPFVGFVESSYPDDADVMYNADRSASEYGPESVRLWDQHLADYVASETAG